MGIKEGAFKLQCPILPMISDLNLMLIGAYRTGSRSCHTYVRHITHILIGVGHLYLPVIPRICNFLTCIDMSFLCNIITKYTPVVSSVNVIT